MNKIQLTYAIIGIRADGSIKCLENRTLPTFESEDINEGLHTLNYLLSGYALNYVESNGEEEFDRYELDIDPRVNGDWGERYKYDI